MPQGAIVVTRAGRGLWGNPFRIVEEPDLPRPFKVVWCGQGCGTHRRRPADWHRILCADRHQPQVKAVEAFERWLAAPAQADLVETIRSELRGKPLACFCGPNSPCHADVLIRIANS
jgi:hypothetical protein